MRGAFLFFLLSSGAYADPKSHYLIHCMGCHLQDGAGLPPEVPAFDSTLGVLAATAAGREYLIRVPGASQAPIDDASLAAVLNWIILEYSPQSGFVPFEIDEVRRHRDQPLVNPTLLRDSLVNQTQ